MMLECATDGCTTTFEKKSNRHKYCAECAEGRKSQYWKDWYATIGHARCQKHYQEHREEILAKAKTEESRTKRHKYNQTPKRKEHLRRKGAEVVALHRERRLREEREGGRHFPRYRARTSEPYLPEHLIWGTPSEVSRRGGGPGLETDQQTDETGE